VWDIDFTFYFLAYNYCLTFLWSLLSAAAKDVADVYTLAIKQRDVKHRLLIKVVGYFRVWSQQAT
jgi:hypothetical protein